MHRDLCLPTCCDIIDHYCGVLITDMIPDDVIPINCRFFLSVKIICEAENCARCRIKGLPVTGYNSGTGKDYQNQNDLSPFRAPACTLYNTLPFIMSCIIFRHKKISQDINLRQVYSHSHKFSLTEMAWQSDSKITKSINLFCSFCQGCEI